jgi:hypothetical protein
MANRYWVGGTDTWDDSAGLKWALTSGGVGGQLAPTTADTVFFDAASGANTITIGAGAVGLSLTTTGFTGTIAFGTNKISLAGNAITVFTGAATYTVTGTPLIELTYAGSTGTRTITASAISEANVVSLNVVAGTDAITTTNTASLKNLNFTGFAGTLNGNTRTIYGNLTISTGMTVTAGTSATTFAATSGTQQITTNGKALDFPITQSGVGGTVQLQDNLTMGSTRTYTLTAGTLDLNNRTLTTAIFSSNNTNVRSIAFGTGQINITFNGGTIWFLSTLAGFSYTGTPTVNCTYAGATGTRTIQHGNTSGGSEANAISFYVTAGTDTFSYSGNTRFKNLDFTGFSGSAYVGQGSFIYGNLNISSTTTILASASLLTFASTSAGNTITSAGKTLDFPITFNGIGGTWAFQDALAQGSTRAFTITNGTVQLKNGATSTVGNFVTSGTNQKFLQSITPGSQATLTQASGTVNASYLTIKDINATGGAEWNAFVNQANIDAGNVDGWNFGISPVVGGAEYTYSMRSFTQPRRF